jgi:methionyl-tRNA formyltransferase
MKKIRVVYFGTWGYGKAGLEELLKNSKADVVKVFTKWDLESDNPYFNQVYETAIQAGIEMVNTREEKLLKTDFENEILKVKDVDVILSCCFDRFFSEQILKHPKIASVNIHPSLLPKYRGVKPLENALANNETEIGVTLHILTKVMDAGNILIQKRDPVNGYQKFGDLYNLQCLRIKQIINEFLENPEQYINSGVEQNENDKSYAPRLSFSISDSDTVNDIVNKMKQNCKTDI